MVLWQCNKLAWPLFCLLHPSVHQDYSWRGEERKPWHHRAEIAITCAIPESEPLFLWLQYTNTNSCNDSPFKLWLSLTECPHGSIQETRMEIKHGKHSSDVLCNTALLYLLKLMLPAGRSVCRFSSWLIQMFLCIPIHIFKQASHCYCWKQSQREVKTN